MVKTINYNFLRLFLCVLNSSKTISLNVDTLYHHAQNSQLLYWMHKYILVWHTCTYANCGFRNIFFVILNVWKFLSKSGVIFVYVALPIPKLSCRPPCFSSTTSRTHCRLKVKLAELKLRELVTNAGSIQHYSRAWLHAPSSTAWEFMIHAQQLRHLKLIRKVTAVVFTLV